MSCSHCSREDDLLNTCPCCGHTNREGIFICEGCGRGLLLDTSDDTLVRQPQPQVLEMDTTRGQETIAHFTPDGCLVLHIVNTAKHITLRLSLKDEAYIILGRSAPDISFTPTIDLTPYGAKEKGVSRTHATIYRRGERLALVDLGSTNGTYLNGHRLHPSDEQTLHDRDTISLGELAIRIRFE